MMAAVTPTPTVVGLWPFNDGWTVCPKVSVFFTINKKLPEIQRKLAANSAAAAITDHQRDVPGLLAVRGIPFKEGHHATAPFLR